jgi:hypothetical protein
VQTRSFFWGIQLQDKCGNQGELKSQQVFNGAPQVADRSFLTFTHKCLSLEQKERKAEHDHGKTQQNHEEQ